MERSNDESVACLKGARVSMIEVDEEEEEEEVEEMVC